MSVGVIVTICWIRRKIFTKQIWYSVVSLEHSRGRLLLRQNAGSIHFSLFSISSDLYCFGFTFVVSFFVFPPTLPGFSSCFYFSYRLLFFFSCSFSGYISFVPLALFLSVHFATTHFIHISLLILVLSRFILFVCSFVHFWSLVSSTCIFIVCIFLCSVCSYIPWCFGLSPRLFHWSYYLCSCVFLFLATPFGPSPGWVGFFDSELEIPTLK